MQTETECIVLRHVKTAAGRTMLLVFSQKYGKISIGTSLTDKNSKSKSSLAIRPFTYGRYELYKGREIYNLNGAETKKSFYSFGEDIDKYIAASVALELTEKVIGEEVPEPRIFSLLLDYLNNLEKRTKAFDTLLIAYEVKLLGLLGQAPVLDRCTVCGKAMEEKPKYFSIKEGGVICENCHTDFERNISEKFTENIHSQSPFGLIYAPKFDIVDTLRYFAEKPFSAFEKIALNTPTSMELKEILREYFSYHLDVGPLKSESMM
ncbi:MAG: DNA repair protein RecO [Firmicutes bacterium]|nr:DNA repair protein RecO [Bacillota bacterium]